MAAVAGERARLAAQHSGSTRDLLLSTWRAWVRRQAASASNEPPPAAALAGRLIEESDGDLNLALRALDRLPPDETAQRVKGYLARAADEET